MMKKIWRILTSLIDLRLVLFGVISSILILVWPGLQQEKCGILASAVGGIPENAMNELDVLRMGRWLLLLAFYYFAVGLLLTERKEIELLEMCRYRSYREWWRQRFWGIQAYVLVLYLMCCVIWMAAGAAMGRGMEDNLGSALSFYLHLTACTAVIILAERMADGKMAPMCLIVFEGILYVLSVNLRMPWLAFGMYERCSYAQIGMGVLFVYVLEAAVIAFCYLYGMRNSLEADRKL